MSNFAETISASAPAASSPRLDPANFTLLAVTVDMLAIGCAAGVAETGYNVLAHHWMAMGQGGLRLFSVVALVFALTNLVRRRYALRDYLDLDDHGRRAAGAWSLAFLLAALFGFFDRAHDDVSRGGYVAFFLVGLAFVMAARAGLASFARRAARAGDATVARAVLIGARADVESTVRRRELRQAGLEIDLVVALSDDPARQALQLTEAVKATRRRQLGVAVVAAPLGRGDIVEACLAAFLETPIEVQLKLSPSDARSKVAAERLAAALDGIGLKRSARQLSEADRYAKRVCDFVLAAIALVVFSVPMAAVALAIKLDGPGPVFFVQTRRGFNNRLFRIVKFRTMTTIENGRHVVQAKARDCRVTRMGRWMRRYNVDELPQLLNVLRGEMSLVGPRPHAIPHDRQFSREVDLYARRANMLPGMTGWAQINGYRGAVDSSEHLQRRVEHDLHYVENWSLLLDLWILAMTLFSRHAYRNAF